MGSRPLNFVVSAPSRRPTIISVPLSDARFLVAALRGFGPIEEMPHALAIADKIDGATTHLTDTELTVSPDEEREIFLALDRIAIETQPALPDSLQRLRNALAGIN